MTRATKRAAFYARLSAAGVLARARKADGARSPTHIEDRAPKTPHNPTN